MVVVLEKKAAGSESAKRGTGELGHDWLAILFSKRLRLMDMGMEWNLYDL